MNTTVDKAEIEKKLRSARRFEHKLHWKQRENWKMAGAIRQYLEDNDIYLPDHPDFKYQKHIILKYEEWGDELEKQFIDLIYLYYNLKKGVSVAACFVDEDMSFTTQTILHTYTRHRCDHIWNFRKEQLIRQIYYKWIQANIDIVRKMQPVHITLTVPRDEEGKFEGDRFYGHKIIYYYNYIRKQGWWQAAVYGGEYGLETKKGKYHPGLHIHIHSFALLNFRYDFKRWAICNKKDILEDVLYFMENGDIPKVDIKILKKQSKESLIQLLKDYLGRKKISLKWFQNKMYNAWNRLTGATQMRVERLYNYRKDESGKYITEYVASGVDDIGEIEQAPGEYEYVPLREVRKKFPITKDSSIEDYVAGIMECIKYHFKGDTFKYDDSDEYDIALLHEVLLNTKWKKLYYRFGAFFKDKTLSVQLNMDAEDKGDITQLSLFANPNIESEYINEIIQEAEEKGIEEVEDVDFGKVENIITDLVNPLTMTMANPGDWALCVFKPGNRLHNSKYAKNDPCASIEKAHDLKKVKFISKKTSLSKLVRFAMLGKLDEIYQVDIYGNEIEYYHKILYNLIKRLSKNDIDEIKRKRIEHMYNKIEDYAERLKWRIKEVEVYLRGKGEEFEIKNDGSVTFKPRQIALTEYL